MIYYLILVFLMLAWMFNYKKTNTIGVNGLRQHTYGDFIFLLVLLSSLVFLAGFRGLTGTDTPAYLLFYETGNYPISMEKIYLNLSRFFSNNDISFRTFQIVIAFFTIFPIFLQYWKKSENIYFSILIFYLFGFYLYSFNVSRQTLAATIVSFTYLYFKKNGLKSIVVSLALSIVAIGIHKSSLYILVALILISSISPFLLKNTKLIALIGIFSGILSLYLYKTNYVFNKILSLSANFSEYQGYINTDTAANVLMNKSLFTFIFALIGSIVIVLYCKYPVNYRSSTLFPPLLLFTIFQVFQINWISDRMSIFVLPLIPLFFTNVVYVEKGIDVSKTVKSLMCALSIIMGLLIFSRIVLQNFGQISPYLGW